MQRGVPWEAAGFSNDLPGTWGTGFVPFTLKVLGKEGKKSQQYLGRSGRI